MIKTVNRNTPPPIKTIKSIPLFTPEQYQLDNGIEVYEINMGIQEVSKLELVFRAGRPSERKQSVARATTSLLKEGTKQKTSAQIAEMVDYYGAALRTPFTLDTSGIVLHALNKHFDTLLPLIQDILTEPSFPQRELDAFIKRNQQRLRMDLSKTDVVAYRTITEYLFGVDHPYGYNSQMETYSAITREDLSTHFEQHYHAGNCMIIISGKIDKRIRQLLNQHLGQLRTAKATEYSFPSPQENPQFKHWIDRPNAVQTAVRIGKRLFNRHHPDYQDMYIVSTILGGYFGSRLMSNIREEKGYTYNIFSSIDPLVHDGFFSIGTEVDNQYAEETVKEIYKEIEILQQDLVSTQELNGLRSYLLGNLLMGLDGPFSTHEVIKTLLVDNLSSDYYYQLIETIKQIQPQQIRRLTQKYLQLDTLHEVTVGAR